VAIKRADLWVELEVLELVVLALPKEDCFVETLELAAEK
jgi:hypothetical protein